MSTCKRTYNGTQEDIQFEYMTMVAQERTGFEEAVRMMEAFELLGYKGGPITDGQEEILASTEEMSTPTKQGWTELVGENGGEIYKDGNLVGTYFFESQGMFYLELKNLQTGEEWICRQGAHQWWEATEETREVSLKRACDVPDYRFRSQNK